MKGKVLLAIGVLLVAIQFVPIERVNPPVTGEIPAPEVHAIFERSCYDCHSNETSWPWYSHVAPVSWVVAHDVEEGREHLNFSEWSGYSAEDQAELREEIWDEVEEGEMPLWFYTASHRDSLLSQREKELLKVWSEKPGEVGPKQLQ
jgi:hypothetical protein